MVLLALSLLDSPSLCAGSKTTQPNSRVTGADYALALAAADRFLQAWQSGDIESGTVMLTRQAKQKTTPEELDRLFSSSTPTAYEIERGKFVGYGRGYGSYEFPIVLFCASSSKPRRRFSKIVLLNTGNRDWAVDKLP